MTRRQFLCGGGTMGASPSAFPASAIPAPVQRAIDQWIADDVAARLLGVSQDVFDTPSERKYWSTNTLIDDGAHRTTYLGISRDQHPR